MSDEKEEQESEVPVVVSPFHEMEQQSASVYEKRFTNDENGEGR